MNSCPKYKQITHAPTCVPECLHVCKLQWCQYY